MTPAAPVAAVGPPLRFERLPFVGMAAVAAVSRLDVYDRFVDEHRAVFRMEKSRYVFVPELLVPEPVEAEPLSGCLAGAGAEGAGAGLSAAFAAFVYESER